MTRSATKASPSAAAGDGNQRPGSARNAPRLIEWVSLSNGGKVISVDAKTRTLVTDFATYKADVANVIPPQRAAGIAQLAGVADGTG
jgi:hypothetical protein